MARVGDWIQTFTGKQFWPLDPRPDEICIEDIAHALSMQCRYSGHSKKFYSVCEHSVHVSFTCDPADAFWGLLHDASEAYIVDIPRPIKPYLTNYEKLEALVMAAVCEKFDLPKEMPASVKTADFGMLTSEMEQLMAPPAADWHIDLNAPRVRLFCWDPDTARRMFLHRFNQLAFGG
jgi:hypothetical protein